LDSGRPIIVCEQLVGVRNSSSLTAAAPARPPISDQLRRTTLIRPPRSTSRPARSTRSTRPSTWSAPAGRAAGGFAPAARPARTERSTWRLIAASWATICP
jgi:hypothetical protein